LLGGASEDHAIAISMRVLHHDDGVCALRHRSAGHDLRALTRPDFARKGISGLDFGNTFQRRARRGSIAREHGKSIACRTIEWWVIAIGSDALGKHTSQRGLQSGFFVSGRPRHGVQARESPGDLDHFLPGLLVGEHVREAVAR
jgi:hypothetical protein